MLPALLEIKEPNDLSKHVGRDRHRRTIEQRLVDTGRRMLDEEPRRKPRCRVRILGVEPVALGLESPPVSIEHWIAELREYGREALRRDPSELKERSPRDIQSVRAMPCDRAPLEGIGIRVRVTNRVDGSVGRARVTRTQVQRRRVRIRLARVVRDAARRGVFRPADRCRLERRPVAEPGRCLTPAITGEGGAP